NSYVNLKIATCLVRYADDRLIDQRFHRENFLKIDEIVESFGDVVARAPSKGPRAWPHAHESCIS
ncbi:hypothetical protein, partial [Burkholderia multivorans]|uniref:hypothetical protein n=1 Tax=Burkholderia multivorans TaxID=87883 RepID=UPI001C61407F